MISAPEAARYPFVAALSGCRNGMESVDRFWFSGAPARSWTHEHPTGRLNGEVVPRSRYSRCWLRIDPMTRASWHPSALIANKPGLAACRSLYISALDPPVRVRGAGPT